MSERDSETRPDPDPDRLIGITEASEILGVNRATLANWLHQGRIPALQYGPRGIYRIRYGDVIEFMEASRLPAPDGGDAAVS